MHYDLIIRGGTVIDGTGAPRRVADVAVVGSHIVAVGEVRGTAASEIDATGALVTPGFVDIHTHYDGQVTWSTDLSPSTWHGVTTVVMGNCGVGFAPVHDTDHDRLVDLMEGVEDIPGAALHEGVSWKWRSFVEYMDELDELVFDCDVAAQVPHAALRLHVMGEDGAQRVAADATQLSAMADLAAESVRAGALGFTTSRTKNHRTSKGEYTFTLGAAAAELGAIADRLGALGTGVLQVVSDFDDVDEEFALLREVVRSSGRPMSMTLLQDTRAPQRWERLLELISQANADGLQMTGQSAPRPIGMLLGLDCTLNPFADNAVYAIVAELDHADKLAMLRDPSFRRRLFEAAEHDHPRRLLKEFGRMYELGDPPCYEPAPGTDLATRARDLGVSPTELALDIMLTGDGAGVILFPFANFADGTLDATRDMLVHPHTVIGLSDGGAHVGTICDASFPTTLLTHWGRDRETGLIDLEFLVKLQTSDTANVVGLGDRGVVAPGFRADLNVIDFDRLEAGPPSIVRDLPAGGRRLVQRATGYRHTFVAGTETYRNGRPTGALPGRLVRGARSAGGADGVDDATDAADAADAVPPTHG